jgi:hypothetical protein
MSPSLHIALYRARVLFLVRATINILPLTGLNACSPKAHLTASHAHSMNSKTYFSSNAMSNFLSSVRYSLLNDRRS